MANERFVERDLEEVLKDNKGLLGKPINPKQNLRQLLRITLDSDNYKTLSDAISYFTFLPGHDEDSKEAIITAEEVLRQSFSMEGILQIVSTYHAPSCIRDVFLTTPFWNHFVYVYSLNPLNSEEEEDERE